MYNLSFGNQNCGPNCSRWGGEVGMGEMIQKWGVGVGGNGGGFDECYVNY